MIATTEIGEFEAMPSGNEARIRVPRVAVLVLEGGPQLSDANREVFVSGYRIESGPPESSGMFGTMRVSRARQEA